MTAGGNVVPFRPTEDPGPGQVRCARCARAIPADSRRCLHCGVHFLGPAASFEAAEPAGPPARPGWVRPVAVLVVVLVFLSFVLLF